MKNKRQDFFQEFFKCHLVVQNLSILDGVVPLESPIICNEGPKIKLFLFITFNKEYLLHLYCFLYFKWNISLYECKNNAEKGDFCKMV